MLLELLPAVDVAAGKAVRLTQGEAGSEEDFGHPLAAAQDWISAGAEWIHLVDLDAAFGRGENRAVIAEVVAAAGSGRQRQTTHSAATGRGLAGFCDDQLCCILTVSKPQHH